jgi:tetratricopeptide (TPR) repeat protein
MDDGRLPSRERKHDYQRALRALRSKDYSIALALFSELATGEDLCAALSRYYAGEACQRLGVEQLQQHDFEAAAQSFKRAATFNPQNHSLAKHLACCFAQMGKFEEAGRFADREASHHNAESAPRIRLALCQWRDGQQAAAIQTLRTGTTLQPHNGDWHFQLGVLLAAREAHDSAIAELKRAVELLPNPGEALKHLGLCHGARREAGEAVRCLSLAQQHRPHDAVIGLYLAMAAKAASGAVGAPQVSLTLPDAAPVVEVADIEELTQLISDEPEVIEAFLSLSQTESDEDVFELLAAVIDRSALKAPNDADLFYHRARIHGRLGRRDLAIEYCERAVEINPSQVQALITLARLYLETDRQDDARTRLQQVLALGHEYADVYFHLGCIYRDCGQREEAKTSYHKALQINGGYQAAREALEALAA